MSIEFHINVEQTVFTIALSHIYKELGPVFAQQIRKRIRAVAQKNSAMRRHSTVCSKDDFLPKTKSLRVIFIFVTVPYVTLPQRCVIDSRIVSDHFASSLTLKGRLIKRLEVSAGILDHAYSIQAPGLCAYDFLSQWSESSDIACF